MEIINKVQKDVMTIFSRVSGREHFYLTGGTSLAYFYLRHRKSNDLDFFTADEDIITPFSHQLEQALKNQKMDTRRQRGIDSFVELLVNSAGQTTIVHLAYDAGFRIEETRVFAEHPGLKVDSLIDIAVNKLLALFGRATLRDFIDVYFLVKEAGFTPDDLITKAKIKDPGFDLYWLAVALERINSFKKDSSEMLLLVKPVDFKEMVGFFNIWRMDIAKKLL